MKINKLNYENYVIDYIEGTLSVELKKDFDLFLEKNKDVYEEIKDYMSAPVYEETEEVFENKKAVLQSNNVGKYVLLAMIPILLIGAYFLFNNKTEEAVDTTPIVEKIELENKKEVKVEAIEIKEEVSKEVSPVDEKKVEDKKVTIKKKEVKRTIKEEKKIEPTLNKSNFNLENIAKPSPSELRFAQVETPANTLEVKELAPRAVLNMPSMIGNLDFRFENENAIFADNKMAIAEVETFNGSEVKNKKNKLDWLEMITPSAFEDLDIRESLAIESSPDIDSRKILNAFIPETVVK